MRRALIVGIDDYPGRSRLFACASDATRMRDVLARHADGQPNYRVRLVTRSIERTALRGLVAELFENARGCEILFYFAGHGAMGRWGAELVTTDFCDHALGVSMDDVVLLANGSAASEVTILLDCCHSGALGNTTALQEPSVAAEFQNPRALLREGVSILSAARHAEEADEAHNGGLFTTLLVEGLEGAASDLLGHVTALTLYSFVSRAFGGWGQRPVIKTHISTAKPLRRCRPAIDVTLLRRLPEVFESPDHRFEMDPSFDPPNPLPEVLTEQQETFLFFKALRNVGMLRVEGDTDLYFAAHGSGAVYLTHTGRYYWRLATEGRL